MSFIHLHVHSDYSLLDGASKLDTLIARAKELRSLVQQGTFYRLLSPQGARYAAWQFLRENEALLCVYRILSEPSLPHNPLEDSDTSLSIDAVFARTSLPFCSPNKVLTNLKFIIFEVIITHDFPLLSLINPRASS